MSGMAKFLILMLLLMLGQCVVMPWVFEGSAASGRAARHFFHAETKP